MRKAILPNAGWLVACAALLSPILGGGAQAAGLKPETAITALSRLSAADLDTVRPKGRAFLASIFADPAKDCGAPSSTGPNFDKLCSWSADPDSAWPDLLIGIMGTKIVSVATPHDKLATAIWACRPASEEAGSDGPKLCYVRTTDRKTQDSWTKSWRAFLSAAN